MRPFWLLVPFVFLLAACDDPAPPAAGPGESAELPAETPAAQVRDGLAGIWRPTGDSDLNALVLEDDGQLYLVNGGPRRGLRWEKTDQGDLALHYLDNGGLIVDQTLTATLDNPSLTLEGDSPFAGDYRRDATNIGTVEGRITLPEDAAIPESGVLVLTLRDLSGGDGAPLTQRLTRLALEGDLAQPFRLYFDQTRVAADRRYGLDARALADAATLFAMPAPLRVLDGDQEPVTLPLSSASANADLANTYWKLLQVEGRAVPAPQGQNRQAHLVFHAQQGEVKGNTGCNSLSGRYQSEDRRLTLENLASTEMACTGDNVADDFMAVLSRVASFQVEGQRLNLYDGEGTLLAVLRAEYLY
ncbi:META domain-containing protein [Alloalcanivorax gelatiniphagus]|uniref:META domain-containing protein n=1 Tax=Alloalcanivorax gelatiniphagus TaxID=1194167 RepID=UPI003617E5C9